MVFLAACKGTATSTIIANSTGKVEDGPLHNAIAFLDYNGDGELDNGEPWERTGLDGSYSLTPTQAVYSIVAVTDDITIDTVSGSVVSGMTLKAPSGSSMVTPTTTLMEVSGLTAEQVVKVLGLPVGIDPLTFSAHAVGVDPNNALTVEKANQQVLAVVNSFAAAAEGSGVSETAAFSVALTSLAEVIKAEANKATIVELDLSDAAALAAIETKIVTKVSDLSIYDSNIKSDEFAAIMTDTVKAGDCSGITKSNVIYTEGVNVTAMSADLDIAMTGILLGDVNDTYTGYLDIA